MLALTPPSGLPHYEPSSHQACIPNGHRKEFHEILTRNELGSKTLSRKEDEPLDGGDVELLRSRQTHKMWYPQPCPTMIAGKPVNGNGWEYMDKSILSHITVDWSGFVYPNLSSGTVFALWQTSKANSSRQLQLRHVGSSCEVVTARLSQQEPGC